MFELVRPWAFQPQELPRLRSIDGLFAAWSAGSTGGLELIGRQAITLGGTAANSQGLAGRGWSFTATTTSNASIGTSNATLLSAPLALICVYAITGTPVSSARVCGTLAGSSSGYSIAPTNTNYRGLFSSSGTVTTFTGDSITIGRIVVDVLSLNGSTGRYYQDGVQKATSGSTSYSPGTTSAYRLFMGADNLPATAAPCIVFGGALLSRPIFPQEAAQIDSPAGFWNWLFEPRRIWVPQSAASGLPTLSAATLVNAGGNTYQPRVTYTY